MEKVFKDAFDHEITVKYDATEDKCTVVDNGIEGFSHEISSFSKPDTEIGAENVEYVICIHGLVWEEWSDEATREQIKDFYFENKVVK